MRNFAFGIAAAAVVAFAASSSFAANVDTTTSPAAPTATAATPATAPAPAAAPALPSTLAPGTTPASAPAPVATVAEKDPHAVVCKRLAPETGTRLGSRTQCMTNAQWDEMTREAQEGVKLEAKKGGTMPDRD